MINEIDVRFLIKKQIELKCHEKELNSMKEDFETRNQVIIGLIETEKEQEEELKEILRTQAEEEFKEKGIKKLLGGIGIRVLTKLNYEEENAMNWAEGNMPVAIKRVLDKKQFESFAKENKLEFVFKEEKVTVTFPKEIII